MCNLISSQVRCHLKDIFTSIGKRGLPRDDTLLNKLLDWFGHLGAEVGTSLSNCSAIVEQTSALHFLHTCISHRDLDPNVLAFALKLCARLESAIPVFHDTERALGDLVQNARSSIHWSHPSVRCAVLDVLNCVCQTENGYQWILQRNYLRLAHDCLTGDSIYVEENARALLCACLSRMHVAHDEPQLTTELATILKPISTETQESTHLAISTLRLLNALCTADVSLARHLCEHHELNECLVRAALHLPLGGTNVCLVIGCLLRNECVSKDDWSKFKVIPSDLARTGRFLDAIRFASCLHNNCSEAFRTGCLQREMRSPILVVLNRTGDDENEVLRLVQEAMLSGNKRLHQQLLIQSLVGIDDCVGRQRDALPLFCDLLHDATHNTTVNLNGRARLQQKLLQMCTKFMTGDVELEPIPSETMEQFMNSFIAILLDPTTPTNIVHATFACCAQTILNWPSFWQLTPADPEKVTTPLAICCQRRLHDVEWEIRDSAVEFMTKLLTSVNDNGMTPLVNWLTQHDLYAHAVHGMGDAHSYVRASAIRLLEMIFTNTQPLCEHLLQKFSLETVYCRVVDIITSDTEAFARRAAIELMTNCQQCTILATYHTRTLQVMTAAMLDFDYSARLGAIKFWSGFVDVKSEDILRDLCDTGASDGLISALDDCDTCVRVQTCAVLRKLHDRCAEQPPDGSPIAQFAHRVINADFDAIEKSAKGHVDDSGENMVESLMLDIVTELHKYDSGDGEHITADCY